MKRPLSSRPRVYEARTRAGSVIASSDYARCALKQGAGRKGEMGRVEKEKGGERKEREEERGGRKRDNGGGSRRGKEDEEGGRGMGEGSKEDRGEGKDMGGQEP